MKRLAIIGASYLQEPLIIRAREMGIETHVFAWAKDAVGSKEADFFYPVSITEKEEILAECRRIGIDGICSIASDLAVVTVNYVAEKLRLVGNGIENTTLSTNKQNMRKAFEENNDPSPRSIPAEDANDVDEDISYPVIVKPVDRSGSRGIYKVNDRTGLDEAINASKSQGFIQKALVEEYVEGKEYSVECISYEGIHHFLTITSKYTTGAPHYVERGHLEPADCKGELLEKVKNVVFHALNTLKVRYGASHSEIKIDEDGNIMIIEIGSRMGGDFIGSDLVKLSTGIDYVEAVIQCALGEKPSLAASRHFAAAGVRFICTADDIDEYNIISKSNPEILVKADVPEIIDGQITDSSSRFGYYIMKADDPAVIREHMPMEEGE